MSLCYHCHIVNAHDLESALVQPQEITQKWTVRRGKTVMLFGRKQWCLQRGREGIGTRRGGETVWYQTKAVYERTIREAVAINLMRMRTTDNGIQKVYVKK
jgi:hypothetical protein